MSIDALDRQLIADDIDAYLKQHEEKDLLRFITCGSVDDGKSTLIGRLLFDSKMIFEDHLAAIEAASTHHGTVGSETDLALLTDGLRAEREQGITIDVAYRFFSTQKRKFIIADTPGHEQYTRNMATGASTADLAVILIDARHGILDQTRRHSFISSLLGIQHMIIAINKMDLVDYSQEVYEDIKRQFVDFAARLDVNDIHFIPITALVGDNVVHRSDRTPWFQGRPLLSMLEEVHIASDRNYIDFRLPIQSVLRPHLNFRGYQGTIASGAIKVGDKVMAMPSGKTSHVERIVTFDGDQTEAFPPHAVTVTLTDEIDLSRGDMLVRPKNVPRSARYFEAMVVWMHETPLVNGRGYLLKLGTQNVPADVADIRYRVDVNTLKQVAAHPIDGVPGIQLNEVGRILFEANRNVLFDPYRKNRATGSFIIIDRVTNVTVGAGMILDRHTHDGQQSLRSVPSKHHPLLNAVDGTITKDAREARFGHPASTIWLTGLPRSGKSTVAYALEQRLWNLGCAVHVLDGVAMRLGLSKDLGFSADDRSESSRRAAETARILNDAGLMTIAAFVSPYAADRDRARTRIGSEKFVQVWLETPVSICEQRDQDLYPDGNGIYAQARAGKIKNFTGISAPYESPDDADLVVQTDSLSVDEIVDSILETLKSRSLLPS
ncbi:MAG: sulfate adenylyltransferase subunit CysN [Myxococcota bacterium]|nr:sulfate adenylyltransferase subunit CysN [Myxococcota bacterium]